MEEVLYWYKRPSLELFLRYNNVTNIGPFNIDVGELGTDYREDTDIGAC
jgi:hypothetical protein